MSALSSLLDSMTAEGELYERLPGGTLRCVACAHRCLLRAGRRGICKVRYNQDGKLRVPWGYVAGLQCDPTEKKPFYHLLPGSDTLTFGMLGCDFHCPYCQNWISSQALRDPACEASGTYLRRVTPADIVERGVSTGASLIASSYNEPLITTEWAVAVFKAAVAVGLKCAYVSNGNATPEALEYLRPYLTAFKVDLKSMRDEQYRRLGGVLQHVLDSIQLAHDMGMWVEVVTLVVPGFNDSNDELMDAARYIHSISPDIPWHVTAFHQNYRMTEPEPTSTETIVRAAEIGQEAGLRYVYAGNLPGSVGSYENTHCHHCGKLLVERMGYVILGYDLRPGGLCPQCGNSVPGVWHEDVSAARVGSPSELFSRRPRGVK